MAQEGQGARREGVRRGSSGIRQVHRHLRRGTKEEEVTAQRQHHGGDLRGDYFEHEKDHLQGSHVCEAPGGVGQPYPH